MDNDELSLERMTQVNSVLRILTESIEKLKIALILPHLFENPIMLEQYLDETGYGVCQKLIQQYIKERKLKISTLPSNNATGGAPYLDYRLIKIIDYCHENYNILDYLLPHMQNDLSPQDKSLLDAFQLLRDISEQRLKKYAIAELNKEKRIHEIFHENEMVKKNIQVTQRQLKKQRINLQWKLAAKEAMIQKYEESLSFRKYDNNVKIKQEIRSIRQIHAASAVKQKELQEELEQINANYEKVLKENLKQEKIARDEKNKLLIQLQSLIKKFDQTIGDKIIENMNLQEEYERQKQLYDEFMLEYRREEEEYNRIVRTKEEEEKRKQEEKILLFMMNRAARTIQRRWLRFRKQRSRKQAKKGKGKKGKKK
ncbi:golgin subfamily A member 6-like protein 6 [Musca vetustissima]|uniref:golgin subfamily A member 6-like protein 6 n=1 Tax=Musca vetustissima TaxID=27455 RepID=UPI002AB6CD7B|nr:golgin subfamily A member 6-like protein 6 [Musca vetustissima]